MNVFSKLRIRPLKHWEKIAFLMMIYDVVAISLAYFLALWLRFDCMFSAIRKEYIVAYERFLPIYIVLCLVIFWKARMYQMMWRFASYVELTRVVLATLLASLLHTVLITVLFQRMPTSYYVWGGLFQGALLVAVRFSYRFTLLLTGDRHRTRETAERVMVIGAGQTGQLLIRDITKNKEANDRVVCIIDDNSNKWNRDIDGIPIVGGRDEIMASVERFHVSKICLAIPSATVAQKRDILNICNETGCKLMQVPSMNQLVSGQVTTAMRKVSVEDLLGREPIQTDLEEVFAFLHGKTVLVTGGGGSIGSELCRQIAAHKPGRLIIFDIYENNAYDIQLELREKYPDMALEVLIGSVRDSRRVYEIFEEYRPDVVYHAAAHKHVPLMEDSPCEAIKNNAVGTYKTAYAAMIHGCRRFVLISTDKAVNPTNIMGASKRLCEMVIQAFDAKIKAGRAADLPEIYTHRGKENADKDGSGAVFQEARTEFVAVRFGNVLGSNGSVVPIFKKQIEKGGPVTVTHPDIIRYFMTIPEAVSLVLQAGTYAKGGEIFVLNMGSPVKIDELARNLIKLPGFKPDVDIKIEYTGLRHGEKLYEEKLMAEEGLQSTANDRIHIGCPIAFDIDLFLSQLQDLMAAAYANAPDIRERVEAVVSTYHPEKAGEEGAGRQAG